MSSPQTSPSPNSTDELKDDGQGRTDNPEEKKEEEEKVEALGGITRLIKEYGEGVACYGWLGAIGAMLNGASLPAFFIFFGDMIDMGSSTGRDLKKDAFEIMIKFFIVGVGFFVFNTLQYICWGYYGAKISVAVRKSYFSLLLRQEVAYYDEKNSGALNTAMASECLNIAGMGTAIGLCLQHSITFTAGFVLAFYYSWRLSLVLMAASPLFVMVGVISAWFERQGAAAGLRGDETDKSGKESTKDQVAAAGSFSNEVLVSIRSVQAMPMLLESKLREYKVKLDRILPSAKKTSFGVGLSLGGMFFAFLGVMYSLGYWYGGKLVDEGTIEIGDMYLCMFALPIGAMSLGQLGTANSDLTKARIAANKLFALKDRASKMKEAEIENTKKENGLKGDICFKSITFAYPTDPDTIVLDDVSFEIEKGKTLALVGPSGSGKSTVINLLERYYDPTKGDILIDGEKIHNYDVEYLRKHIGFVSQTPLLFAESVKDNIGGGNPNISEEDIIAAAKSADAHDFIMELPEKYDTNVGEMGNRLSGGQKQRIAIARAIVSNPSILLLDEATSALDTKSEREVQKAIDNISSTHSKTIVVIAHRLSTIKNADKILVIVDGEIGEEGTHESLIEADGVYAALVREQQVTDVIHDEDELSEYEENNEPKDQGRSETGVITVKVDDGKEEKDEKKEEKEEEKTPDMGGTKRLTKDYGSSFKWVFSTAVVFALLNGAVFPIAYGWFFPEIIVILSEEISCEADPISAALMCHTTFEAAATKLAMWWIIIGIYAFICQLNSTYWFGIYGTQLANIVKYYWFEAVLHQDIMYHDTETSASLNTNLTVETQSISDAMGWKYGLLLTSFSQIIFSFVIAFYRSWRVSLVFLGLTPLLIITGALQTFLWMGMDTENADPFLASGATSQEILTNIRTVLAFPYLITSKTQTFVDKVNIGLPIATKRALISGISMGVTLLMAQGVLYGLGMYIGLRFVDAGWTSFDDVLGAFFGVLMGGMAMGQAGSVAAVFKTANIAANKFYVAKEREPQMKKRENDEAIKKTLKGSIEFKNVSFSYHSAPNKMVLNDVSFRVDSGSTLAIVGPSGSGKSTIISLIERFYDVNEGDIILDDNDKIHNYDVSSLRSSIGLVSQMPLLFDSSIEDNIRGGNMDATHDDIIDAAKQANAHGFIDKFNKKYDTNVGELGTKLSGGQRQRIAIARALLNKPAILLLDEATSALDSKSEREVQEAIDNITQNGNKTVISIAHRLSTIKNANNIIVLVDAKVKEHGNHSELMDKQGVYAALVNAQTLVEQKKQIHKRRSQVIDKDELPQYNGI